MSCRAAALPTIYQLPTLRKFSTSRTRLAGTPLSSLNCLPKHERQCATHRPEDILYKHTATRRPPIPMEVNKDGPTCNFQACLIPPATMVKRGIKSLDLLIIKVCHLAQTNYVALQHRR